MRKVSRILAFLCVVAMIATVLSCAAFAASPSSYTNDGRNLAVIANGDVNIYGDAMFIDGSVYSNGTIYCGDGAGNKINGIFISGTEGSVDENTVEGAESWKCDGYIHVNDNGTRDGITYYSSKPEYNGAIKDDSTSFECSYKPFTVPTIANNIGDVLMTVYPSGLWVWSEAEGSIFEVKEDEAPRTITEDTYIENLTMNGSWVDAYKAAMIIDTTAGDVNVVINNIVEAVNPSIIVVGPNKANIYINNAKDLRNFRVNYSYDTTTWQLVPVSSSENTNIYVTGNDIVINGSQISANVNVNAKSLEVSGATKMIGDVDTSAEKFATIGGEASITGTVCAPNADSEVINSSTIYGQLHTDTLTINGAGRIIYRPDTIPPTKDDEPETPTETAKPEGEPAYIVRYVVATGEYSRGTMKTKMHKPARGVNAEGIQEEELEYEVLDENTYEITGPQELSQEVKDRVQLILNTTNDVFVQRGSEGLLQKSRFGRIDSNGTDMSLSITPYAYPQMSSVINTMYLCWGDRDSQVETVWYVIPEELR